MEGVMMSTTSKSALCLLIFFALTAFILYLMAESPTPVRSERMEAPQAVRQIPSSGGIRQRLARPTGAYANEQRPIDELGVIRCLDHITERANGEANERRLWPHAVRQGRCPL
jgi:uncharacterized SAM-binding protein YcdF (DUF218 family)